MSSPDTAYQLSSPQRTQSPDTSVANPRIALDLSALPPIFVSATHFEALDLHEFEDELNKSKATLTYDVSEAKIIISKVSKTARIKFDLRSKGLFTQDVAYAPGREDNDIVSSSSKISPQKRNWNSYQGSSYQDAILVDDSKSGSEEIHEPSNLSSRELQKLHSSKRYYSSNVHKKKSEVSETVVHVISTAWFEDSKRQGRVQALDPYIKYQGIPIVKPTTFEAPVHDGPHQEAKVQSTSPRSVGAVETSSGNRILARAKEDSPTLGQKRDRFGRRKFGLNMPSADPASWEAGHGVSRRSRPLLRTDSTDHEVGPSDLPEMPEWVKEGVKYACQRATPGHTPNDAFIELLKKIKLARLLTNDEVGVRAYSTSIASIAACPQKISDPREILALPGCDSKIANLFIEWTDTGRIQAVDDLEADEDLRVLRVFYDIWGVGATTAREFYYEKGWNDLDDIVEYGWSALSRVQQIGLKYYEEFQDPIPRAEVERIGHIVHEHAVRVRDEGIQTMIVGGYRRGKEASGDVDIIVSHPEEGQTLNIVNDIVSSLEDEEWITHTLYLSLHNSNRGQATLPFRAGGGGHGFDTLDKALVVWQDPQWATKERDLAEDPATKNPNIHRRVDIIISPWRTVGCAVVGWSGGTTFERDLRRYAKHKHAWKFDSSGVRDRRNGEVVDMEGYYRWHGREGHEARAKTMEEAERRVFESMGIPYRTPRERCTH